jgi:CheY-like chemotaxis protein
MKCAVVVEDDEAIRQMLIDMAEGWGCTVAAFESGDTASTYLEGLSDEPSLLISDHAMPGGLQGAELVSRTHRRWPRLPIIMISAYSYDVELPEADHVVLLGKPWTITSLTELAEGLMNCRAQ